MTRKGSISIILVLVGLVAALAVTPASALEKPGSVDGVARYDGDPQADPSRGLQDPGSVDAVARYDGGRQQSTSDGSGFQGSVDAIARYGGDAPQAVPTSSVGQGDGFDWTDALIGGLVASGLLSIAFLTARSGARRRPTVESSA
jgi:hypothetical protein